MLPKSVTTAIGMEISKEIGGIVPVSVAVIVLTGITGAVIGPGLLKLFHIKDEVAQGVAIGTASHAVGTSKAMELGETQGAMSGLSIGIAGLATVILAPLLMGLL
jgi:putative effector of murein hydrolase